MRPRQTTLGILLACFLAGTAFGEDSRRQGGGDNGAALLLHFDTNGDGKIDDEERRAVRERLRARQTRPGAMTPSGETETVGDRLVTEMDYASSDGRKIPCVLSMPEGQGPFPVLVTIHGGQGNRDLAYLRTMAAPNGLSPTVTAFNEQPWAILAISYRAGNGALFGMEHDDVIAGIRFAKTLPKIDPDRVGVVGGSHGGHLALVAAEKMGREFLCVAAGSPWMTDPIVYMTGEPDQPPLSEVPAEPREAIVRNGRKLFENLQRGRGMSEAQAREFLARHSIDAQADAIEVPTLFLTSRGDDQVPHALVEPMIEKMQAAGKDVEVYTAEKSPHGFYWARSVGAARALRGEKTPEEAREEEEARRRMIDFFTRHFAVSATMPAGAAPKSDGIEAPSAGREPTIDERIRPPREQADRVRRLRERVADMPVPQGLERRTIRVCAVDREYFLHVPATVAGKPAPVVFALHGGAANSGLQMHLKVDYTPLADAEGFVVVYPSGVAGWNIGSHDAYSVRRRTSDADDLGFFRAMFDALAKEGVADPKRIYVTGGSNGGVMTQYLACAMPERIAGIGVVVATLPKAAERDWPKPAVPVPAVVMLGTDDTLKPWDGSRDQFSAAETVAFWRRVNGCGAAEPVRKELPDRDPTDGCRVTRESWPGKAPLVFYTLEGHGHGWPMQRGRADMGTGPKTCDISAPEEMWAFLRNKAR